MLGRLSFPQPWLSLLLFSIWQLLSGGVSGGSVVLGLILAWGIPQLTQSFWPERPAVFKVWRLPGYLLLVLWDIVIASFEVAWLIISPRRPKPMFISYPLQLDCPQAIVILASTISLTPGTVSADISDDHKHLLIHALDTRTAEEVIKAIHNRYEKPLMEMFQ
ncbi:Na+/H+ antiporter subunit E [Marinobacter sp. M3C]|jgi:multicomponent K+:H+ antiporter subunit E|uniref:Na+/H+ antiporter subunit E n=1 Tax=Marinobacter sp. M3C TaxID=2917715 RepID=UPI00200FD0A0|nr:Na+/H+ antiporter subunit E [Marinobacter sp. M3C]MCL1477593.1 Na+/H+ antiporter subunit E [Marinobacter sp.]MCL1481352.1 Na+/H+ antiporter subunit E [Marinobacter sp.]UQG59845.1 Na+/H+ antiporter subunit E [Marinobacter sp. M3C]